MTLKKIFDSMLGLGSTHINYSGKSILEMFDTLTPYDIQNLQENIKLGIKGVVDKLNKGFWDNITLQECAGYLISTGNHRMVNLAVLYHTAMANPNLTYREKMDIQNLELKTTVAQLSGEVEIRGNYGKREIPSFLPELVEQEKQQKLEQQNEIVSGAMDKIKDVMSEQEGFFERYKKRFEDALNDDPEFIASNIKDIVDIAKRDVGSFGVDESTIERANSMQLEHNQTLYQIEQRQREISKLQDSLNNNQSFLDKNVAILSTMKNPKEPKKWWQKLFDTKKKKALRQAYYQQSDVCSRAKANIKTVTEQIAKLKQEIAELSKKASEEDNNLKQIQPELNKALTIRNHNYKLAENLAKVAADVLPKLAQTLGAEYPYYKNDNGERYRIVVSSTFKRY